MKKMLTKRALKNRENVKEVHSNRLGVSYTVTIRKYNTVTGERNTQLRRLMEQQYTKETLVSQKQYYKSYSHLRFDAVRSPQQLQRWNRLTNGTLNQERQTYKVKPFILNEPEPGLPNPTVFKAIHHLSYKYVDTYLASRNAPLLDPNYKNMKRRWRNWVWGLKNGIRKRKNCLLSFLVRLGTRRIIIVKPTISTCSTTKYDVGSTSVPSHITNTVTIVPLDFTKCTFENAHKS